MKVCLIGAPTLPEFGDLATVNELRDTLADAPLGILSLAGVLESLQMDPEVLATNRYYYEYLASPRRTLRGADFCEFMAQEIAASPAELFGFSSISSSYPLTIRMAAELRRLRPRSTIIFGGPQASVVDEETLSAFPWVDIVVRGEAEETLPRLISSIAGGEPLEQVPGLAFRSGGTIVRTPNAPPIQDLDALPMPAYHLYFPPFPSDYIPLELGRGCPFACTFCSTNDFFRRRFRLKSPGRMLEQMTTLHLKYGVKRFELVHDMFTVDRKRVVEFCQVLYASKRGFTWSCSARTDCIDEELIDIMAQAGCDGIFFGIETGSARLQKLIDKDLNLNESARVVDHAHQRGIGTTVSLIIGFPEESKDDLRDTADFLLNALRYDDVETHLQLLAPLGKTPIQLQYKEQLFLEHQSCELSRLGWEQNPLEQDLVRSYPNIFSNFYFLPTHLERRYLEEFNAFYLTARSQFRWLLISLHEREGNIVSLFDDWREWQLRKGTMNPKQTAFRYYLSAVFIRDFFDFVASRYLGRHPQDAAVLTMLAFELKWREAAHRIQNVVLTRNGKASEPSAIRVTLDSVPMIAPGACLVPVDVEASRVIKQLRTKQKGDVDVGSPETYEYLCIRSTDDLRIDVLWLSPLSAELMTLCDGQSNLEELGRRFTARMRDPLPGLETLSLRQVCISGLLMLAEQGLLAFVAVEGNSQASSQVSVTTGTN